MHVLVLGAGVVGVTTAYYLVRKGHRVTIVDRAADVASGASHANGGQLSYSFTDSLAKPAFFSSLPGILAGRDMGAQVRIGSALLPWGLRFLGQCTQKHARRNTVDLLKTAMHSADLMSELRQHLSFDFAFRPAGKLVLLGSDDEIEAAERTAKLKKNHGCETEILGADETIGLEPALAHFAEPFKAAVYSENDEVADAHLFVVRLREYLESTGKAEFRMSTRIDELIEEGGHITGVRGDSSIRADAVVVCLGAWSNEVLRKVGIHPRIYPVRGYSLTLPTAENSPVVSITSLRNRIVFSRLNGNMRIAGFADFGGFDTSSDNTRLGDLERIARNAAPLAADYDAEETHPWGGFRPMTPDGKPRVGPSGIDGLYLNTGHGMLGWTLACATAEATADSIRPPH